MAREDETALMLLNEKKEAALSEVKKENSALKKSMNPLGMAGMGAVAAATATAIGLGEGFRTKGQPEAEKAVQGVAGAVALVGGGIGAVAAGANNPKLRATSAGVAIGGACALGYALGRKEGIDMALEAAAQRGNQVQVQGVKKA